MVGQINIIRVVVGKGAREEELWDVGEGEKLRNVLRRMEGGPV